MTTYDCRRPVRPGAATSDRGEEQPELLRTTQQLGCGRGHRCVQLAESHREGDHHQQDQGDPGHGQRGAIPARATASADLRRTWPGQLRGRLRPAEQQSADRHATCRDQQRDHGRCQHQQRRQQQRSGDEEQLDRRRIQREGHATCHRIGEDDAPGRPKSRIRRRIGQPGGGRDGHQCDRGDAGDGGQCQQHRQRGADQRRRNQHLPLSDPIHRPPPPRRAYGDADRVRARHRPASA